MLHIIIGLTGLLAAISGVVCAFFTLTLGFGLEVKSWSCLALFAILNVLATILARMCAKAVAK